jgi:NAD(P)H-nitrite reductase large subunit
MVDHFISGSDAHLWRGKDWLEAMDVDYRPGVRVVNLGPTLHRLDLESGESLEYTQLVIATGSRLYAPLQNAHLPGVYNFKSLSAAEALIGRVKSGAAVTALVVGAGFIGMEIALLLRRLGVEVTMVEMLDQVMSNMLDTHTAAFALNALRERGVVVHLNTKATAFVGDQVATGVQLESGDVLSADILVAATGVHPNLEFLQDSGITYQWGVQVDEFLRTDAPDVYACGDVAETPDRLTGEVYVHAIFPNAVEQGRVVGMNLAGVEQVYQGAERMNSLKHLDLPIMAVGLKAGDQVLRRRINGSERTLYLQENRLVGYQLVGDIRAAGALRTLLLRGDKVDRVKDLLLEPTFGQGAMVWKSLSPQL